MALPTVQAAATKYVNRASGAGADWQAGAARFEGDPTALAAAQGAKAVNAYSQAWTSGRIARKLAQVGKAGWLAGINRPEAVTSYTAGVSGKGAAKWAAAMNTWFPIFQGLQSQIQSMPKATPQDSINRVAAWINGTIQAKQNL